MDARIIFQNQHSKVGAIELTATLSEGHGRAVDTTDFPREAGGDAIDHIRQKPATLRMEAVIADAPLPGGQRQPVSPADAWDALERVLDAGELITIQTSLKKYTNMVLTSLDASRDAAGRGALRFSAQFRSATIVTLQTVKVVRPKQRNAQDEKKSGKKAPMPAPEERGSFLYYISKGKGASVDTGLDALQKWRESPF